jgi:hypothetical protein
LKALERKYSESPNAFHRLQGSVETQVLQNRETATSSSSSVKTDSTFAAKSLLSEELLSLLIELNLEEFGPVLDEKYGVKVNSQSILLCAFLWIFQIVNDSQVSQRLCCFFFRA